MNAERSKGGRVFAKSSKEKKDERIAKPGKHYESTIDNTTTKSTTSVINLNFFPEIKVEHELQEPLPDGVINIEVDGGLYEYSREVVVYLKVLEVIDPIPLGLFDEGSVTPDMRSILVDWIIQVQHHLKLCQETLYLGIGILDMVLHRRDVDPDKLQLVGVTALLVASKLEEYYPVDIKKLLHLTENSYTRVEVTHMERTVLDVLEFQVYLPSPQVFLLRFSRAAIRSDDPEFLKTCQYLLDTHLPPSFPSLPPSFPPCSCCRGRLLPSVPRVCKHLHPHGLHHLDTNPGPLHQLQPHHAPDNLPGDAGPSSRRDHLHHKVHGGADQVQELVPAPEAGVGQAPDGGCLEESQSSPDELGMILQQL